MIEKQTTLDLNGPILSFITQPVGINTSLSTATFVGIATATFPTQTPANPATNTGTIEYRWYADGSALTDGAFRGATISGTATTTLTISNPKSPETNNANFFLRADYIPSAYGLPGVAITEGTARFTGNAVNGSLDSNTVKLTVLPTITITSQPETATIGAGNRVSFSVSATISDSSFGDLSYQWSVNGKNVEDNGRRVIGATQPTLFFTPIDVGISTVRVIVSNPSGVSVVSTGATLKVLEPRKILFIEGYTPQNNYENKEVNLDNGADFTLRDTTFGSDFNIITFHAPENDLDLEMEIRASKGNDMTSRSGGNGGVSKIRTTLRRNDEYTVLGISNNSGLFIYRGATLIAVVGEGGDAGSRGNGGDGGGVNNAGGDGGGRGSGAGGKKIDRGKLSINGIFGSNSTPTTVFSGDTTANIPSGGRTISCSKGSYWAELGILPCKDIGINQFYNTNGELISQSELINRGFKSGYTITSTAGKASSPTGGNGGEGATGGSGGGSGGGGGGGSGYTDGSVVVLESIPGENKSSKSTINFKIYVAPPVYYDDSSSSSSRQTYAGTAGGINQNAGYSQSQIYSGGSGSAVIGGGGAQRAFDDGYTTAEVQAWINSAGAQVGPEARALGLK